MMTVTMAHASAIGATKEIVQIHRTYFSAQTKIMFVICLRKAAALFCEAIHTLLANTQKGLLAETGMEHAQSLKQEHAARLMDFLSSPLRKLYPFVTYIDKDCLILKLELYFLLADTQSPISLGAKGGLMFSL